MTNVLTHYRVPLYRKLQERFDLRVVFYSDGGEWYWNQQQKPTPGELSGARWLRGAWIGRTRLVPGLVPLLLRDKCDVVVKGVDGKFALPVTYTLARLRNKRFVLWASIWQHPSTPLHRLSRPLVRHVYRRADAIVTYGRHVTRYVVSEGADPLKVFEAPQAVSASGLIPQADSRWTAPRQMLFVGRLEPWKGVDILLRALAELDPDAWRLTVAGDGSARAELHALAASLNISANVSWLGHVPNSALTPLYAAAGMVFVPSLRTSQFTEPWALVVNEAMQQGACVVASDAVGAVADGLITDGDTGYVFPAGDHVALAKVLRRSLTAPDDVRRLAKRGREAVAAYSYMSAVDGFERAISAALSADSAGRRPARQSSRLGRAHSDGGS